MERRAFLKLAGAGLGLIACRMAGINPGKYTPSPIAETNLTPTTDSTKAPTATGEPPSTPTQESTARPTPEKTKYIDNRLVKYGYELEDWKVNGIRMADN